MSLQSPRSVPEPLLSVTMSPFCFTQQVSARGRLSRCGAAALSRRAVVISAQPRPRRSEVDFARTRLQGPAHTRLRPESVGRTCTQVRCAYVSDRSAVSHQLGFQRHLLGARTSSLHRRGRRMTLEVRVDAR